MNIRAKIFGGSEPAEPALIRAKSPKGAKADALDSIAVARAETRRANTREDDRHRLAEEAAAVVHQGKSYDVELINLSGGGAMVAGGIPAKLWDRVELRVGTDGMIDCAVCWIKGDRVGLAFAQETRLDCSVGEQAAILREVVARSFPDVEFEATTAPAPVHEDNGPDQRHGQRHPLIWSGVLHYDFASHPIRLRNISSTGAMIECQAPLHVGAEPLLELGGEVQASAMVTWVAGDTAGLRFTRPFELARLADSRPEIAQQQWKRPEYLRANLPAEAPPVDDWNHMSMGDLRQYLEGFWKR
jgi:hypothetical protein